MTATLPSPTLYVSNIDWKIKKPLLRRALYSLFTRHGKVLEIVTLRKDGLRGQAWVIMDDVQAATAALQAENGVNFFGKDLVIQYSKEISDRIAKRDGTYVPKAKRKKVDSTNNAPNATFAEPPNAPTSPPSHILIAQSLSEDVTLEMLKILFHQYTGYKDVRLPRPGLAFIEFESEPHATLALQALNGFKLTASDNLQLEYGKA
ncbi:hypothetical protein MHU86_6969 [Fragilaria crotonensis]|nr:hypothetical protein MHU86_6969 [Fragilaria crotonensis]